jgi:hypothetical protein
MNRSYGLVAIGFYVVAALAIDLATTNASHAQSSRPGSAKAPVVRPAPISAVAPPRLRQGAMGGPVDRPTGINGTGMQSRHRSRQ